MPSVVLQPYGSDPPGEDWHPYRTALALLTAYDEGDPVRILAALDLEWDPVRMYDFEKERSVPPQAYIFGGRALASFGPPATNLVARAIREGSPRAIKVAGFTGREELVPALQARARTETEEVRKRLIEDALGLLGVEGVPASGPASRPSGGER
ncbi:MAG TPA: HEAT repeat domain-containing protein [Planctomycetota bacterium]|nr:HEAT repeat domain-containing protein [Planctomycetota bacterium]